MDLEVRLFKATTDMELMSRRLGELSSLIGTVHLGLEKEKVERQTLDCMACIFYSVKELHGLAEQMLSNMKNEGHE